MDWKPKLIETPHDSHGQSVSGFLGIFTHCIAPLVAYAQRSIQEMGDAQWIHMCKEYMWLKFHQMKTAFG